MRIARHLWAQGRLERFVDKELVPELADRVQAHLHECKMCRAEVASLLGLRTALQARLGRPVDAAVVARLQTWASTELPTLLP